MSQLIHIRHRIKAIQTIQKITHAMRLISMSMHSRLKYKETSLKTYTQTISDLFYTLSHAYPSWTSPLLQPLSTVANKQLIILIGAQKGLCGNFNNGVFSLFEKHKIHHSSTTDYILIGKRAIEYGKNITHGSIIKTIAHYSNHTRNQTASTIANIIASAQSPYTQVIIISNTLKTFFQQKPVLTTVIPVAQPEHYMQSPHHSDYIWEQEPYTILDHLSSWYLTTIIEHVLFQSLFAEHATRFISMDTATRNAETILEETKLKYNKLRQAKITKELTELTGSNSI